MKAIDKYYLKLLEKEDKKVKRYRHKCNNCQWGTWTGVNFKCALPRCIPNLGNFVGVDTNGKT